MAEFRRFGRVTIKTPPAPSGRTDQGMRCYFGSRWSEVSARRYPSLMDASSIQVASSSRCLRLASSTVLAMCLMTWLRAARIANSAPMASIITVTSDLLAVGCVGASSIGQGRPGRISFVTKEIAHV